MFRSRLAAHFAIPILVVALLGIGAFVLHAGSSARERIIEQETRAAIAKIREYRELRTYYTDNVVAKARAAGLEATFGHEGVPGAIPLPATLIHELSSRFEAGQQPVRMRLYSADPFPNRTDRDLDDFAQTALRRFEIDPEGSLDRLAKIEGERWIRVAVADRMTAQACVDCHNSHPTSPRRDWKLGDVRGVLQVDVQVEPALQAAEAMQTRLSLLGGVLVLVLVATVFLGMRRVGRRIAGTVEALERIANGSLDIDVSTDEPDELGRFNAALDSAAREMRSNVAALEQIQAVVEHAPVSFILCDLTGSVTFLNPHCQRMLAGIDRVDGLDATQIRSGDVSFLFEDLREMREIMSEGGALPYRGLRKIGQEVFDVSIDALYSANGARTGNLVTLELVTEEQETAIRLNQAIEAERESANRSRETAEADKKRADRDQALAQDLETKANQISEVMGHAAAGDLSQRTGLRGDSPMDHVARELDAFLDDLAGRILQIREMSALLNEAGQQLDQAGREMLDGASRTTEEVDVVSMAWRVADERVGEIGSSVEGFGVSFESISENASSAVEIAGNGVVAAEAARRAIQDLDQSTQQIEIILTVIDQIADQSKLLALNASIEAARAGDRGLGFNVVAQEVKKLATQTEEATKEIGSTVAQILERAELSVRSIHGIGTVINEINASQRGIAETVDAQLGTTREIQRIAGGTQESSAVIASSIKKLSQVADSTQENAAGTARAAQAVLELAAQIGELTARFER